MGIFGESWRRKERLLLWMRTQLEITKLGNSRGRRKGLGKFNRPRLFLGVGLGGRQRKLQKVRRVLPILRRQVASGGRL